MAEEDVGLVFDPSSFQKGFDGIEKRMAGLQSTASSFGAGMSKAVFKAEAAVKILGGAFRSVMSTISTQMPEIGAVFGTVKDIFFRNFLFPLRQTLLPLLQKLLDWTRTHRAMFVQWGQTAVSIFNVLVNVVKAAVSLLERFWNGIRGTFVQIFGTQTKTFSEFINMAIFKIATVATAAAILLGPIIDAIAGMVKDILPGFMKIIDALGKLAWEAITNFIKGFSSVSPEIKSVWHDLGVAFTDLGTALAGLSGNKFDSVFQMLGKLAGTTLTVGIGALTGVIDAFAASLELLGGNMKAFNTVILNWAATLDKIFKALGFKPLFEGVVDVTTASELQAGAARAAGETPTTAAPVNPYTGKTATTGSGDFGTNAPLPITVTKGGEQLAPNQSIPWVAQLRKDAGIPITVTNNITVQGNLDAAAADKLTKEMKKAFLDALMRAGQ